MDHVAIMRREWKLLSKILSGQKTIESRWYKARKSPWDRIKAGETVYFKDSGSPVTVKARVFKVLQFEGLIPPTVGKLIDQYGGAIGIDLGDRDNFKKSLADKKYCLLIFLNHVESLAPFEIDKKGYGLQSAWLMTESIERLKNKPF